MVCDRGVTQTITLLLLNGETRFSPSPVHVVFGVDKVALGQVLSEYFGFPLSYHFAITQRSFWSNPTNIIRDANAYFFSALWKFRLHL